MDNNEIIRIVSVRTGLGLKFISKERHISDILSKLQERLGDKNIIMKGGTALNRVYIKKRFSEDIDLDFISDKTVSEKLKITDKIMNDIEGFDIRKARKMGEVYRYDCFFDNDFGEKDKIRVEFNFSQKSLFCAKEPEKSIIESFILPGDSSLIYVYSIEDMIAHKISALLGREEGKDIFDLFFSFDIKFNRSDLMRALSILIKKDTKNIKKTAIEKLDDMKKKSVLIRNSTSHYIPYDLRPEWNSFIETLKYKIEKNL